jgi:hypothetical protein
LSIEEAKEIPGGLGDPVRAISAFPGVSPLSRGSPYLYLRGAPPGNSAYLVDGVRVPLLFHAGLASSILEPALIEQLDFFPSAVPARYGGIAGGVVEIETRAPLDRVRSEATAKLYEAGALIESPFLDARGSALAAFRYGYPQIVLALVDPSTKIGYWDYQSRATWQLGAHDRLTLFAFGSHDRTSHTTNLDSGGTVEIEDLASDFHRADLRLEHEFNSTDRLRLAATIGWSSIGASPTYLDDWTYAARIEAQASAGPGLRIRAGAQLEANAYRSTGTAPLLGPDGAPIGADPPPSNLTAGAYVDLVVRWGESVEITPGLRADVFRSVRADPLASGTVPAVDPRLAVRVGLADGIDWLSSLGLAHQLPLLRVGNAPANALSVPGFAAGATHLQSSAQISEGLELHLPLEFLLRTTGFGSLTTGLIDLPNTCYDQVAGTRSMPGPTTYLCADTPTHGLAYGLELSLRRSVAHGLTGWLSYTLSRTTERYPGAASAVPSPYDRTHVLSAIAAYDLGAGFRASARVVAYSGTPDLRLSGGQRLAVDGFRFPAFVRLDARFEKQWWLGPEQSLALVLEAQNATLSKEYDALDCNSPSAPPSACQLRAGPTIFIPSIGLEGAF